MALVDTWRARRALIEAGPLEPVGDSSLRLSGVIDTLGERLGATSRVDDDVVHERRDGRLQLVGLEVAGDRSPDDVRRRVVRVAHEMHLGHFDAPRRRVVAVLLGPAIREARAWLGRLDAGADRAWHDVRRQVALIVIDAEGRVALRGGDHDVDRALRDWRAATAGDRACASRPPTRPGPRPSRARAAG